MGDDDSTTDQQQAAPESGTEQQEREQATEVPPEVKRALRQANKEAETLRLKLKEYEDRDKTEQERTAEARQQAESRAVEAESRALRLEVAFEKGLTPAQAKRLVGSSREELESDADEILRDFPAPAPVPQVPPTFSGGPRQSVADPDPGPGLSRLRAAYGASKTP